MSTRRSTGKPSTATPADVDGFLSELAHPEQAGIARLRTLIRSLDPRITEEIKWNAPSFRLDDHFATFKLHPPKGIQLVLHTGAKGRSGDNTFKVDDPDKLLKWAASDRCVLTLASSRDVDTHEAAVRRILMQWMAQL
jgi:hypothetical protein